MADEHLIEFELQSEAVFDGVLLKVRRDQVRVPSGSVAIREWVAHPGAVVMIAQLNSGNLLFERQFRYPLRRVFLELPAGKIDANEQPIATAIRELREETGYEASDWQYLGVMHPCIGYSDERIEIFLARGLTYVERGLDEEEFLDVVELSLPEAVNAIRDGAITDAKTITALMWAEKVISGAW